MKHRIPRNRHQRYDWLKLAGMLVLALGGMAIAIVLAGMVGCAAAGGRQLSPDVVAQVATTLAANLDASLGAELAAIKVQVESGPKITADEVGELTMTTNQAAPLLIVGFLAFMALDRLLDWLQCRWKKRRSVGT